MRIDTKKLKRLLLLNFPYIFVGLIATNIGEGWRLAEGANSSEKLLSFMTTLPAAFQTPLPSFHPLDLLIGILCGAALRLAVYLKGKNAKKYRHNTEYGSARWGTHKDIEPFMDEKPENNIILTKTEGLTMSSRPKNPAGLGGGSRKPTGESQQGAGCLPHIYFNVPRKLTLYPSLSQTRKGISWYLVAVFCCPRAIL